MVTMKGLDLQKITKEDLQEIIGNNVYERTYFDNNRKTIQAELIKRVEPRIAKKWDMYINHLNKLTETTRGGNDRRSLKGAFRDNLTDIFYYHWYVDIGDFEETIEYIVNETMKKIQIFNSMTIYKFYIYTDNKASYYRNFGEARQAIKSINNNTYTTLGVSKNIHSCDLLIKDSGKYRISEDYKKSPNFQNDALITHNTIEILKREFDI